MAGPTLPTLPVVVDPAMKQVDGDNDSTNVYQTHRGKQPTTHSDHGQAPAPYVPETALRYAES